MFTLLSIFLNLIALHDNVRRHLWKTIRLHNHAIFQITVNN